jgi:hypothetical protein
MQCADWTQIKEKMEYFNRSAKYEYVISPTCEPASPFLNSLPQKIRLAANSSCKILIIKIRKTDRSQH